MNPSRTTIKKERGQSVMLKNKKYGKLAVLSLLGVLGLTACGSSSTDAIYSKPSNYNDNIVDIVEGEGQTPATIHNNLLNIIYDAIHDGSFGSQVLEEVLYKYAESIYGGYSQKTIKDTSKTSLKEAYDIAKKINLHETDNTQPNASEEEVTKLNDFIKGHKVYWVYNLSGKHIDSGTGEEVKDESSWTPGVAERANVVSTFENAIENRIAENMYSKISSGTYSRKKFFREFEFIQSLYFSGKKVDYTLARDNFYNFKPTLISYQLEGEDVFDIANLGVLHKEYYQSDNATYIEDEVVPEVYKDLLVEQYLLDQEITAVRNSRARKINVLKIEKYSSWPINADVLLDSLIDEIYSEEYESTHVRYFAEDRGTALGNENYINNLFKKYEMVSKGLYDKINADPTSPAAKLVQKLQAAGSDIYQEEEFKFNNPHYDPSDPSSKPVLYDYKYYKNTAYGDLVEEFEKFNKSLEKNNYDALDTTLYNKFTSNGTVSVEEGFDQARIDIAETKNITKGWFINSSQPTLDSNGKINERLFTMSVATAKKEIKDDNDTTLADLEALDRFAKDTDGKFKYRGAPVSGEDTFLASINGAYFLKFDGQSTGSDERHDIVYDDGSAYYIVHVIEAVKDSKLKRTGQEGDSSYATTRGDDFYNEVIDAVSKKVAETGSYASLSKNYWIKKMVLSFHDQKVYDYFKDNYPDIFQ